MTSQSHSEPADNHSSPAHKGRPFHKPTTGLGFLSWFWAGSERGLGVCELPSQYVQRASWNNKHADTIRPQFFWHSDYTQVKWMQGSGFHQAAPTWKFPHRWIPPSNHVHCLPVNRERSPRKRKSDRACSDNAVWWDSPSFVGRAVPSALCCRLCHKLGNGKQQVFEWNGLSFHDIQHILYVCWWGQDGKDRFLCQIIPIKAFEFIAFSLLLLALLFFPKR